MKLAGWGAVGVAAVYATGYWHQSMPLHTQVFSATAIGLFAASIFMSRPRMARFGEQLLIGTALLGLTILCAKTGKLFSPWFYWVLGVGFLGRLATPGIAGLVWPIVSAMTAAVFFAIERRAEGSVIVETLFPLDAMWAPLGLVGTLLGLSLISIRKSRDAAEDAHELASITPGIPREVRPIEADLLSLTAQDLYWVELSGTLRELPSSRQERVLATVEGTPTLWQWLNEFDPAVAGRLQLLWPQWMRHGCDGVGTLRWIASVLPQRMLCGDRVFRLDYRAVVRRGELAGVLLAIADITESFLAMESEEEQHELLQLFSRIVSDGAGVRRFLLATHERIKDVVRSEDLKVQRRELAFLAAQFAVSGLVRLAGVCRRLESGLAAGRPAYSASEFRELEGPWHGLTRKVLPLFVAVDDRLQVDLDELQSALVVADRRGCDPELREMLARWADGPVARELSQIALLAQANAAALGKVSLHVEVDSGGLRLPEMQWRTFWATASGLARWLVVALPSGNVASDSATVMTVSMRCDAAAQVRFDLRLRGDVLRQQEGRFVGEEALEFLRRLDRAAEEPELKREFQNALELFLEACRGRQATIIAAVEPGHTIHLTCEMPRNLDALSRPIENRLDSPPAKAREAA